MAVCKELSSVYGEVLEMLPLGMGGEIRELLERGGRRFLHTEEIRLRAGGRCSLICDGAEYTLLSPFTETEGKELLSRLCHGSVYAYREEIADGYISLGSGVRVGVVGDAKYEGGGLVGVRSVDSFVFRFPPSDCNFIDELYTSYLSLGGGSMLIASPPCGGKTTALRALARKLGEGKDARRVVVVDERREFRKEDYELCTVDLMQGYKRGIGIEIALRTMSAEYILVDELCTERDVSALFPAAYAGVNVVATVHADSLSGLKRRRGIGEIIDNGVFRLFALIKRENGDFAVEVGRI